MTDKLVIEPIPTDGNERCCMESFNREGILVQRTYGLSPKEMQEAHDNHTCGCFCGICYDEAMKSIDL